MEELIEKYEQTIGDNKTGNISNYIAKIETINDLMERLILLLEIDVYWEIDKNEISILTAD